MTRSIPQVVVVGGGIGGLTTAAALARLGLDVTVLEAHVYTGGCAGTFYHQGYRFDAGATLAAGFYPGGPMEQAAAACGVLDWEVERSDLAMQVHLPEGISVPLYGDERRHAARRAAFGPAAARFFAWQERTADALWELAVNSPAWPPQSGRDLGDLARLGLPWAARRLSQLPGLGRDAFSPLARRLDGQSAALRQFIDGQLLISAQGLSAHINALYGAAALDLPRRGVVHPRGGMGGVALRLAAALRAAGGRLHLRQEVTQITPAEGGYRLATRRGASFFADRVILNLPRANIRPLFEPDWTPRPSDLPVDGWGAFMLYLGVAADAIPDDAPLHHQILTGAGWGEGASVFLSLSPVWDTSRAPVGQRVLTLSTHTRLAPWWDRDDYQARKELYARRLRAAAETIFPRLQDRVHLQLAGTPRSFQRFTRRYRGWVGGFPQTNLGRASGPHLAPGVYQVGDSIFPGQSTAAVALGGLRVARTVQQDAAAAAPRLFPSSLGAKRKEME
jgi:C-3',4' desaturase CrtD